MKVLYAGVCFFISFSLSAQQGVLSSGGDGYSSSGSISYSIGQVDYQAIDHSSGSTNEGLQVPYEIYLEVGVESAKTPWLIRLYPNPTQDELILDFGSQDIDQMSYGIYDMSGHLLEEGRILQSKSRLSLSRYSAATYMLKILGSDDQNLTYRIIKNN